MPEIMPFGKYKDLSVEQIALKDYKYFMYVLEQIPIQKPSLNKRFKHVHRVGNNFVSEKKCALNDCSNPAEYISIATSYDYRNPFMTSSLNFIYCSKQCFDRAPDANHNSARLYRLGFDVSLSSTKFDTNALIEIIAKCMGMKEKGRTKEYLEDFFNNCKLRH